MVENSSLVIVGLRSQQQLIINLSYFINRFYTLLCAAIDFAFPLCYVPLSQKRASTAVLIFIM